MSCKNYFFKRKQATLKVIERLAILEREIREIKYANIFSNSIGVDSWMHGVSMNVGKWAANYSFLYILYRILNELRPLNILELGMGETTKMLQHYKMKHNSAANCISVETNSKWIKLLKQQWLNEEIIHILNLPLQLRVINGIETKVYKGLKSKLDVQPDLIIVDGPAGTDRYSRIDVIELVESNLLPQNFIILFDDIHRTGEAETVNLLLDKLRQKNYAASINYFYGESDQALIANEELLLQLSY